MTLFVVAEYLVPVADPLNVILKAFIHPSVSAIANPLLKAGAPLTVTVIEAPLGAMPPSCET